MIRAVIFDLDDTLISEEEYVCSGYRYLSEVIGKRYGFKALEIYQELFCLYRQDKNRVFNRLLEKKKISYRAEEIEDLVEAYRGHFPAIHFFEDVLPALEQLSLLKIKTGIISDGYLEMQIQKARALSLEKYFERILFTEELGREFWKPHPKAFERMGEYFNLAYKEMLYVGDNPEKDFYIKTLLPVRTVRILRAHGVYLDRKYRGGIKEDYRINSLLELFDAGILQ